MSTRHPIIAVTGSSGAGTSTARVAFERIFHRLQVTPAFVEGDAFHAHDREHMAEAKEKATIRGENFSHFGPEANLLGRLDSLFSEYAKAGTGHTRRYLHDAIQAQPFRRPPGTFTEWEPLPNGSDLLMYEGLHGGVVTDRVDVASRVDLLVGMTPAINLEWIQKIRRDTDERGHEPEQVTQNILRRMPDSCTTSCRNSPGPTSIFSVYRWWIRPIRSSRETSPTRTSPWSLSVSATRRTGRWISPIC